MKTEVVEIKTYERGDVLDISCIKAQHQKQRLTDAKRCVVLNARKLTSGRYSYVVLTDEMKRVSITPEEMIGEEYIGNIDFGALTDG